MRSLQKAGLLPKSMFSGHSDRPLSTGPTSLTFPDIQGVCREESTTSSFRRQGGTKNSYIFNLNNPFSFFQLKQRQRLSIQTCVYAIYDVKCQANSKPSQILWAKIDKLESQILSLLLIRDFQTGRCEHKASHSQEAVGEEKEMEERVHCCSVCLKMKGVVTSHHITGGDRAGASHCPLRHSVSTRTNVGLTIKLCLFIYDIFQTPLMTF